VFEFVGRFYLLLVVPTKRKMKFLLDIFTKNKFCLFNYAIIATGGDVDFAWFSTKP